MKSEPPSQPSDCNDHTVVSTATAANETELDTEFMFCWFKEMLFTADSKNFCATIKEVGKDPFLKVLCYRDQLGKSLEDYAKLLEEQAGDDHIKCIKTFQKDNIKLSPPAVLDYANRYSNLLQIGTQISRFSETAGQAN